VDRLGACAIISRERLLPGHGFPSGSRQVATGAFTERDGEPPRRPFPAADGFRRTWGQEGAEVDRQAGQLRGGQAGHSLWVETQAWGEGEPSRKGQL